MGIWQSIKDWVNEEPELQTRSDSIEDLIARMGINRANPWRKAGIKEALGVPAIFGAVNLISNITSSMSMRAYRGEVELPPADRPRVIVRPDPFTIPREFYRSTTYNLASRGEAWWWVAKRDIDGMALSILSVPPQEVMVEENPLDLRYPIIRWRDKKMDNADFLQLVYAKEPGELRGVGPLQMCGAAVSVAVEAQTWAANFYAEGGGGGTLIKAAGFLGATLDENGLSEADRLRAQWVDAPNNVPKVIDEGIADVTEREVNQQGAQMMEARGYQNVEVATMFGMDAPFLNAAITGSSLQYQNVGTEFEKFLRKCLRPNYLEVIEQTMSDLLPRAIVARFNTDALTLADIKTRYDVYGVGITNGIITPELAQRFEGIAPGDVENAAVPYSPPQAIPASLAFQTRSAEAVRCAGSVVRSRRMVGCGKLLGNFSPPYSIICPRCKHLNEADAKPLQVRAMPVPRLRLAQPQPEPEEAPAPVTILEPAPPQSVVNFHEGAFQTHVTVPEREPAQPINMSDVVKTIAMRVVFDRDPETNRIRAFHEEPV